MRAMRVPLPVPPRLIAAQDPTAGGKRLIGPDVALVAEGNAGVDVHAHRRPEPVGLSPQQWIGVGLEVLDLCERSGVFDHVAFALVEFQADLQAVGGDGFRGVTRGEP
jgi:hypothetical protein